MLRTLTVAILVATGSLAHADSGMLPGGATLQFNRLFLHESSCTGYCFEGMCYSGDGTCGGTQSQQQPLHNPTSLWTYFNFAHCVCSQPNAAQLSPFYENTYAYEILLKNQTTPIHAPLEIWVGTSCDDSIMRPMNCHKIDSAGIADIASIQTTNGIAPEVPLFDLMEPEPTHAGMGCEQRVLSTAEWAISDVNSDGSIGSTPQYFVSQSIGVDTLPPPLPTTFHVDGAESAIQISWDPPVGDVADVAYYQALCATQPGNQPAKPTSHPAPRYQTPNMLCNALYNVTLTRANVDCPSPRTAPPQAVADAAIDAPPDAPPDASPSDVDAGVTCTGGEVDTSALAALDPTFLCGENPDATATSMRIDGLQDGQSYAVVLLAIDKYGNPAAVYFPYPLTPKPVTDFWQDLQGRGSKVEGGFCLIAETFGDDNPLTQAMRGFRDGTLAHSLFGRWLTTAYYATLGKLGWIVHGHIVLRVLSAIALLPLIAIALLWNVLTLPGLLALIALLVIARRRRWRLALPKWAVVPVVLLVPARAFAQQPYWEDEKNESNPTSLADEPEDVTWHAAIRLGPYIPQIDKQFGMQPGPYEQMFGSGSSWMPMFDLDRVLWRDVGQLAAGITIGYLSNSAHAWAVCQPGDTTCNDTPGDPNRTRSQGDTTSFHLLPLSLNASYRFTYLDDDYGVPIVPYARGGLAYYVWWIDGADGSISSYMGNSARGASMGLVGAVGLAIRAERIDSDAARSMRDSGIQHAGFFAELQAAWVDGFGKSSKLSVGDNTWFAGVDFEF